MRRFLILKTRWYFLMIMSIYRRHLKFLNFYFNIFTSEFLFYIDLLHISQLSHISTSKLIYNILSSESIIHHLNAEKEDIDMLLPKYGTQFEKTVKCHKISILANDTYQQIQLMKQYYYSVNYSYSLHLSNLSLSILYIIISLSEKLLYRETSTIPHYSDH